MIQFQFLLVSFLVMRNTIRIQAARAKVDVCALLRRGAKVTRLIKTSTIILQVRNKYPRRVKLFEVIIRVDDIYTSERIVVKTINARFKNGVFKECRHSCVTQKKKDLLFS